MDFFEGITKKEVDTLVKFHSDYGKETKDDFRICDKCANFTVSPDGCSESCDILKKCPFIMRQYYYESRRDGIAKTCKEFRKL